MGKSVERFSKTVQDYVKFRPGYPKDIIDTLVRECHFNQQKIIADVGSGTGLLTRLFLDYGNTVYGIEPNHLMREAGELLLNSYAGFYSVNGTAEQTHLDDHSIDLITVGTAFHWFDREKTKTEFLRILKPTSWVALVWNVRDLDNSALMRDYEHLLHQYATDYLQSNAAKFDQLNLSDFFSPHQMRIATFENKQVFNWEGLKGRLLSTSYSLREGDQDYEKMLLNLKCIFNKYQHDGKVEFLYKTKVYFGVL